jgi:ketosteroid isomerase-like protein
MMRRFLMAPILVWCGAVVPALWAQAAEETATDGPLAVVRAYHDALAGGDSSRVLALLLPDAVIFESGAVEASRDEYRAAHLPTDMAYARATQRQILSEHVGTAGDAAWVLTEARAIGMFRSRPVDSRGVETMVLRRTTEGWRIAHIHWSSRRGGN